MEYEFTTKHDAYAVLDEYFEKFATVDEYEKFCDTVFAAGSKDAHKISIAHNHVEEIYEDWDHEAATGKSQGAAALSD